MATIQTVDNFQNNLIPVVKGKDGFITGELNTNWNDPNFIDTYLFS